MIIGLVGNLGRGKTLGMTMLGHVFQLETDLNQVVSNYETDITTDYVTNANELEKISQNVEGIYLIDEIWAWMSSRDAMNNDEMIDLIINSRKRGCLIIYTVQNLKMADNILTDVTDYFGVCSHYESHEIGSDHDVAEVQLINQDGEPVKNYKYNAETYYGTYDTGQEISSTDDAEKYSDVLEDVKNGFENDYFECSITEQEEQGFNTKKDAIGFLELNTDLSHSKKDAIVNEAYRTADIEDGDSEGQKSFQEF